MADIVDQPVEEVLRHPRPAALRVCGGMHHQRAGRQRIAGLRRIAREPRLGQRCAAGQARSCPGLLHRTRGVLLIRRVRQRHPKALMLIVFHGYHPPFRASRKISAAKPTGRPFED